METKIDIENLAVDIHVQIKNKSAPAGLKILKIDLEQKYPCIEIGYRAVDKIIIYPTGFIDIRVNDVGLPGWESNIDFIQWLSDITKPHTKKENHGK